MLAIRLYGGFQFDWGLMWLLLIFANRYAAAHGGHDLHLLRGLSELVLLGGASLLICRWWSIIVGVGVALYSAMYGVLTGHGILIGRVIVCCLYSVTLLGSAAYWLFLRRRRLTPNTDRSPASGKL